MVEPILLLLTAIIWFSFQNPLRSVFVPSSITYLTIELGNILAAVYQDPLIWIDLYRVHPSRYDFVASNQRENESHSPSQPYNVGMIRFTGFTLCSTCSAQIGRRKGPFNMLVLEETFHFL